MNYHIHTKVSWEQKLSKPWEDTFYPSLTKKIRKSDSYFEELFELKITPVENISEADNFFSIYNKEIASRGNYIYKPDEQKNILDKKILDGKKYTQASIINKNTNQYAGGIIFSIVDDKLSFALRAFDKETRSNYRSVTTIDFWVEKKIFEYARNEKLPAISHGTDNYPNKGRVGLVLFKLKLGGKPKVSKKEHEVLELSDLDIVNFNVPTFFWDKPDENEYFKTAHLFYAPGSIDESVLGELIKVCEWAGVELLIHQS